MLDRSVSWTVHRRARTVGPVRQPSSSSVSLWKLTAWTVAFPSPCFTDALHRNPHIDRRRDSGSSRRFPTMSSSAEEPSCNWLELPRDITAAILQRIGVVEILSNAQCVCTQWWSICREPSMWRTIYMGSEAYPWEREHHRHLESMCRQAVDRSCGGLVDISILYFGTDELLTHIAASCTQIKRLCLVSCIGFSKGTISEIASKLSMLEDLELSYCSLLEETLEAVGRHCPHLKSLKYNCHGYYNGYCFRIPYIGEDKGAHAIAKTMPELRQLQLVGNILTNVGLEAILNGCPHLEFLDLRQCLSLNLDGKLGKRCAERIKDLRRPLDSTHDYEQRAELEDDYSSDEDTSLQTSMTMVSTMAVT
ncbi:putative F-box/LRR-repeat protein 23 [Punica granatum]|uniref:F-box domain-containing protein n=2 Tax=Punica granatum TaxID=22663 RepID=A0A218WF43_PUNGR|nr:putative F-box/LRR-repeat protein 23 [Punica granatum]OWM71286.1 hypothetical protein CDL15_Pgr011413 [Punica granatum]PKI59009.1 hypothetical protein CRG98_020577 [Punica granatum]